MLESVFTQVGILLGVTVSVAFVMRLLRQPLMTAYLIAGIVAGPFFLGLLNGDQELFRALAEFGVVLLLFVVGLSLNFDHIRKIGKVSLISGLSQTIFTVCFGYLILTLLGFAQGTSLYLAFALTFSSTIVIVKLLNDKKDSQSVYGRYTLGLMIVQDIIALLLMIVLTSFTGEVSIAEAGSQLLINIIFLVALVAFLARVVVPRILPHVAGSSEFLFIFTVAWCFGVAAVVHALGFSTEVGALIAGLTLGSSPYQSEISSRVRPLRDFFIVIFFLILGSELSLANLGEVILPGLILSVFILFGNPFILYHSFRLQKFTRRNSFLAGVTAAQVSEFGFVLLLLGQQFGHIGGTEVSIFTFVALVTIILSSYAITYNEQLYRFFLPLFNYFGADKYRQIEEKVPNYDVWLFGYHRIGWKLAQEFKKRKVRFAVVDYNPAAIAKLKRQGIPAFFGDASDVEFISQLPLDKAKLVVSTLPEVQDQLTLVRYVKELKERGKPYMVTTLYEIYSIKVMYDAGSDYVLMPHLVGGDWMSRVLSEERWTQKLFKELKKEQHQEMKMRFSDGVHD